VSISTRQSDEVGPHNILDDLGRLRASPFVFMFDRACIFVDGENLRHSLVELFRGEFDQSDYLPKKAQWHEFFTHLIELSGAKQRIRTYWYVVENMDFWPWGIPIDEPDKLISVLCRDVDSRAKLSALDGQEKQDLAIRLGEELKARMNRMQKRFAGWSIIHEGIARIHDAVEFRRSGAITYNLFTQQLGTEKAVDVKLAIDLLELHEIYDLAIIVSGDQDYTPAVQAIKNKGKRVINISFLKRDGKLLPSGARRLNSITDKAIQIEYQDLRRLMCLQPSIPQVTVT
jgi:uncharacterized LabA/DUF88 family protein